MLEKTYVTLGYKELHEEEGKETVVHECYHSEEVNANRGAEGYYYRPLFKEFDKALEVLMWVKKQLEEEAYVEKYGVDELDGLPVLLCQTPYTKGELLHDGKVIIAKISKHSLGGETCYGVGHDTLGWYRADAEGNTL